MKLLFRLSILIFFSSLSFTYAQIGINTQTPDPSSAFDITSSSGGILIPRLTNSQKNNISNPATGLMIYQIDSTPGFYFYNGTSWEQLITSVNLLVTSSKIVDGTITSSDLSSGIDATKIGSGLVTDTEFGYIDGLTSSAQTQITGLGTDIATNTTAISANTSSITTLSSTISNISPNKTNTYRVINTFYDQTFNLTNDSSVSGVISDVNTDYVSISFFPAYNLYNSITLSLIFKDVNNQVLNKYVESLYFERNRDYTTRRDFSSVKNEKFNTNNFFKLYRVPSPNGLNWSAEDAVNYLDIWSNGETSTIEYIITLDNTNDNYIETINPTLKIVKY